MKKIPLILVILSLLTMLTMQYALGEQQMSDVSSTAIQDTVAQEDATATPAPEEEPAEDAEEAEDMETEAMEDEQPEGMSVTIEVPFYDAWVNSPHADGEAEAFVHWDEDDPAEVPARCAKCHSTPGMLDYLGADGSEALVVDSPAPLGSVVECAACHNSVSVDKETVVMPSGIVLEHLGAEQSCVECHQGRAAGSTVDEAIAEAGLEDMDAISEDLGFINIHYYTAAVSKFGTIAKGGYEYEGASYDAFFMHVEDYSQCQDCHDPHSLELKLDECTACHVDVEEVEDLRDIRMAGSYRDYNGNGDVEEGIYYEMEGMRETLYQAILQYSAQILDAPIIYSSASYPYFFNDTDGDGEVSEGEANYGNAYASWSPRMLKAAYNFQTASKDPGSYAHGGKYIIELMYDSIMDLNEAMTEPMDVAGLIREDAGHFAGSEEAWRHWDGDDMTVSGRCAKCHSASGLPTFIAEGVNVSEPAANGMACSTCHNDLNEYTLYEVESVTFPSGAELSSEGAGDNLCMQCHQGRASGVDVVRATQGIEDDEVSDSLRFINPHYFAAAATRYGAEAIGAYQYDGQEYFGYFEHVRSSRSCADCHTAHKLEVQWEDCADCHDNVEGPEDLVNIREYEDDFDGDGDAVEGIAFELETIREMLYEAMQTYATETVGVGIAYNDHAYPYFFQDLDGDGIASPGESNRANSFSQWTPRLLRAAYNFQYAEKDTGSYAHNGQYLIQVLYDTLTDIGVDTSGMVRPQ